MERFNAQRNFCDGVPNSRACPLMMKAALKEMHALEEAHHELTDAMRRRRHRRNLFTAPQRMANWLKDARELGATYSSDYYDDVIDGRLAEAAWMNVIRANYSQLDQRNHRLDEMKEELSSHMDRLVAMDKENQLKLSDMIKYFEHMYDVAKLTRIQFELLTEVILYEKAEVVTSGLMTQSQFVEQLQNVSVEQIVGTSFVYPLDTQHADQLIGISKFIKFFSNSKIVFVLQVPMSGVRFELYRVHPLPVFAKDRKGFAFIPPSFTYFAISPATGEYAVMRSLQECQELGEISGKICKNHLVYLANKVPLCEASLLLERSVRNCDQREVHGNLLIYHQLSSKEFLLSSTDQVRMHIFCSDFRESTDLSWSSQVTGIISVHDVDCNITVNGVQFQLESGLANHSTDVIPSDIGVGRGGELINVDFNITKLHQLVDIIRFPVGKRRLPAADWYYKYLLKIIGLAMSGLFFYVTWQLCATLNLRKEK